MSSSGINAINSGPLIIRSYLGSSSNNTYALGDNDIPISSNRVLITSTNGLVVLSDNIYVSSITVSSINGGGGGSDVFWSSTLNSGGIINTNTGIVNISTALIVDGSLSTLRIFDNTGSLGTTGQVLTAGPVFGGQVVWSNTLNVLSVSTTSISTTSISTTSISTSSLNATGDIYATGSAISRVATATIVADPTSSGWINYLGKYCFVNGDSLSILTLPTAGDVPPDGTIIVIRNIGASGNITVNNVVGGASIILSGRTTSFIYTTTVTSGWYTL